MTDPRLVLIPKPELSDAQIRLIDARVAAPEHQHDGGPLGSWRQFSASNQLATLYAFLRKEDGVPIGIVEASGLPITTPAWWIDSKFRGRGYWRELVDLLAAHLKSKGVTGVGRMPIITYQGAHDEASIAMAKRFKAHFPDQ
jgi:RimJ/RimL family protein N-acetyltransferase